LAYSILAFPSSALCIGLSSFVAPDIWFINLFLGCLKLLFPVVSRVVVADLSGYSYEHRSASKITTRDSFILVGLHSVLLKCYSSHCFPSRAKPCQFNFVA
jgi:hypothetical protein